MAGFPRRIFVLSTIGLYLCAAFRHEMFASEAWDLGIFDQAIYLISQGLPPISTLLGFHMMADHAALVFYPLALLYRMIPTVHWLLLLQAVAIAGGSWLVWQLAKDRDIDDRGATLLSWVYLLYPVVFNANKADFHPETFAISGFLGAVLAARKQQSWEFALCLLLILACRDALALNVAAMGIWLWLFERRRKYGLTCLVVGIAWFWVATQVIVPESSAGVVSMNRYLKLYAGLGDSYGEIIRNLLLNPQILLGTFVTRQNLEYLLLLAAPVIWAMHPRYWTPLIGAAPTIALNLMSDNDGLRSLADQYSVAVFPFVMLVMIAGYRDRLKLWTRKTILAWSMIGFLVLGKWGLFWIYAKNVDTWWASRATTGLIRDQGGVLTDTMLVPHVSHRSVVQRIGSQTSLEPYDHVLINRHRPWLGNQAAIQALTDQIRLDGGFKKVYDYDGIVLFQRNPR